MSQSNITQTIIDTINTIFNNLFSSIDNNLYSILDKLLFINTDFLNDSFFENLLGHSVSKNLLIIANALLVGFTIYYCFKLLFSHFSYTEVEKPYQFIFKLIIFGICMNCSYFICEKIIETNYLISESICYIGKNIFNTDISFSNLIQKLDSLIIIGNNSFDIFSVDGIIKSFISIGLFNLIFSYSLRYILIKVFVLISPFAFLTLINHSTSWFFKTWIRAFFSLLLLQSFAAIILLIIFSFNFDITNLFSKFLLIGGIYALTKANSYIKELIGGVTTDVQVNFSNFKNK
ncbi:MAG: hypothetical protein J6M60_06025 [Clostridia bacterium]|nr:hypothetical protein [Clostridia bacterium]